PDDVLAYNARVMAERWRLEARATKSVKDAQAFKLIQERIRQYYEPAMIWRKGQDGRNRADIEEVFSRKRSGADAWLDDQLSRSTSAQP
ncbi:MAG: hypothetical protein LC731_08785, partial [Acidobacteria bacterium]|nr:hypothetical protein [Acidobacteriota bacterium]